LIQAGKLWQIKTAEPALPEKRDTAKQSFPQKADDETKVEHEESERLQKRCKKRHCF